MQFTWDEAKRLENLRKHGLDFADAERVFDGKFFGAKTRVTDTMSSG